MLIGIMAHVSYVEAEDMPEEYRYLLKKDDNEKVNLFRGLGNNAPVLQSYMRWGTTLWEETGLTRQEVEIVILAVARGLDAEYEWHQHVQMAREFGVDDETILAIADEDHDQLTDRQAALVSYTLAFLSREVDQSLYDDLKLTFDSETITGLTMLVGHYLMTAYALEAMGIEPESEFVGWTLEQDD